MFRNYLVTALSLSWPTGVWAIQLKHSPRSTAMALCHLDGPHLRAMTTELGGRHVP